MMDSERWRSHFNDYSNSSFLDVLRRESPHLIPGHEPPQAAAIPEPIHGTTVLSVRFRDGVIMAGDRQATAGYQVASRRIEKIFKSDELSGVGIAGAAGPAMEMAKLFQTELEHYEKVEGENLSLEGKANRLSQMIRMNLPAAMQGLVVVPIFAGFDEKAGLGRLFAAGHDGAGPFARAIRESGLSLLARPVEHAGPGTRRLHPDRRRQAR